MGFGVCVCVYGLIGSITKHIILKYKVLYITNTRTHTSFNLRIVKLDERPRTLAQPLIAIYDGV